MNPTLSIIVPVLNEAASIESTLVSLPIEAECIVVDGGSQDETVAIARQCGASVLSGARGRARQMNLGAAQAHGDVLVFLHGDTRLPGNFIGEIQAFWQSGRAWGRFDIRLSGSRWAFRVIEFMMNWRSRLTGICTGDQVLFFRRGEFDAMGGFADIPLMEDIELSRRCKRLSRPWCSSVKVMSSSRRWEAQGICRTVLWMWWYRLSYFFGVSPEALARHYYR
ncbi:MAG: TIGR04283 family arsenosugar biosynthesis glycosyltransferase, partial [Pseudohongiellaceae bacterium]